MSSKVELIAGSIFLIILIIVFILSVVWYVMAKNALLECRSTESNYCPSYLCNSVTNPGVGSPCVSILTTENVDANGKTTKILGPNVPFRFVKGDKTNIQCQGYRVPDNYISTWTAT